MTTWLLSVCLQRLVIPAALIAGITLRQNVFSFIYLLLLLCAPLVPIPSSKTMAGSAGHFQRAIIVLTSLNLFASIAFQLVLAFAFPPYGHLVEPKCSFLEALFRHIGLVRLDGLTIGGYVRYICPELIVLVVGITAYRTCCKLHPAPLLAEGLLPISETQQAVDSQQAMVAQRRTALFTILGKYICLMIMCLAGILWPSVLSAIYYLSFLGLATAWACNRLLGRGFAYFSRCLMCLLVLHITALFVYQLQWIQELLPPESQIPRYIGLTALVLTSCENDPRLCDINKLEWASFLNPFILILLYFALSFESDAILNAPGDSDLHTLQEAFTESTPLIRGRDSVYRRTPTRRGLLQDDRGSVTLTEMSEDESKVESPQDKTLVNEDNGERIPLEELKKLSSLTSEKPKTREAGVLEIIINAGLTIAQLLAQSSYIATNIIMMAWSITYHSWLTFVLLLWASVMWLMPNQRRAMLKSSPFLVLYALFLLLAQYIYGMDLTDQELPQTVQGLNLKQIGFEKVVYLPCKPLLIKTCFTLMFWITLKQYIIEKEDERSSSAIADIAAPLQLGVGTATGIGDESQTKTNQFVEKIGNYCRSVLTKFWIWIVACILFAIGIYGERMTIFRIVYMALALFFILTFQISWSLWRKIMYGFWLTVIIYSMLILVMTYTYQFDDFDYYWEHFLHIDKKLQKDIGLERFDTANLFVELLTPTFFVIITVIQLYYFHKDFLAISDIKSRGTSSTRRVRASSLSDATSGIQSRFPDQSDSDVDSEYVPLEIKRTKSIHIRETLKKLSWLTITNYLWKQWLYISELFWLFLELHMLKIVMFTIMLVAIEDVCALHMLFVVMTIISLMFTTNLQIVIAHSMSLFASLVLLAKMIYQIDYIDHNNFSVTCEGENKTYNMAEWIGFRKTDSENPLHYLLFGYIAIILIVTLHAVVITRQKYQRHLKGRSLTRPLVMFPGITFVHADKNIRYCLKYLANYVFYRFGIEICLISMTVLISSRMDIYACVYAIWVIIIVIPRRTVLSVIWPILTLFIGITIPFQYFLVIGLPPFLCFTYPWAGNEEMLQSLREWLYLPDEVEPPLSYKLLCDFIVYLMVCRQGVVFRIEKKHIEGSYAGGTNSSIIHQADNDNFVNPTMDYISYTRSYLDVVKRIVFQMFLWVTLAIVFLAGSNRVNVFSLGYLIGAFIFLWQGNDLYLRPVSAILKWWHCLIFYNVFVIFVKTILQMAGCLFLNELTTHACWAVQLFGVACIKKFGIPVSPRGAFDADTCDVYHGDVGLAWDGVCFAFLILQRRLFNSYYFFHIIDEAKAMSILASRGAELIEQLSEKRIEEQQEAERKILEKIKNKMDRIKASQKKLQGPNYKEPDNHFVAIRSGDYYMFEDFEDEELDDFSSGLSSSEDSEEAVDKQRPGLAQLLSNVLKSDMTSAADKALEQEEKAMEGQRRRASMPPALHRQAPPRMRAISLPGSPQRLGRIDEVLEPQAGSSQQADDNEKSETSGSQKKNIRFDEEDSGKEGAELIGEEVHTSPRMKAINFLKFLIAFIISIMVTITIWLNKFSRDYRFVMKTLSIEKKQLKANKNFGCGVRRGSGQVWEPLPVAIATKTKSSPMSMEDFEGSDEMDTKSQPAVIRLLMAMWYAVFSHSELLCYFIIFLHQVRSPTILSLPLPLMVFLWGTLTVPRPSKTFWITIIAYTEVVVVLKCICQFELIPWNSKLIPDNAPFAPPRIIGVERLPGMYAYYDLLLLLVVFFHRSMLKSLGLWKVSSYSTGPKSSPVSEMTDVEMSLKTEDGTAPFSRDSKAEPDLTQSSSQLTIANQRESLIQDEPDKHEDHISMRLKSKKFFWPFIKFFHILLRRTGKVTDDVYAYMFFCDFFNFLVVIFGFAAFGSSQGDDGGVSQYFEENKVPIPFLVMLILQFGLIIVDRTLYLRKFILGKIIFQFILVIGIHVWMFFVLPAVTQRSFNAALPPQMWYMVKCIYLLLSAYQIRVGYPTRILGNFLCKSYNYINMFLFKVFMLVPFVFELRALMDWIWTDTSMTLSDWLKMEDIFAHVFQLKCQRRAENEYPQARGEKKANAVKYVMGGGCLVGIIAVIWFPLVLFALGNTVGEPNLPYEVSISVQISSFLPIYRYTVQNFSINKISAGDWDKFGEAYKKSRTAQTFLSTYEFEDVGVIHLKGNSSSMWTMSPPAINTLKDQLMSNEALHVRFSWKMRRFTNNPEEPPQAQDGVDSWLIPGDPARVNLYKVLDNESFVPTEPIIFRNIMPKFIKVTSRGTATPINQLMIYDDEAGIKEKRRSITVSPIHLQQSAWWWDIREDCNDSTYANLLKFLPENTCSDGIVLYTFNDKAFPASLNIISGKGIIGLYTTFVIVIHSVIRGFFTGISFKIMFDDMPNVDRLLQLCLDIYLVRESGDLDLEEDLFAKLVFLYRSPETLIKWTRPAEEVGDDEPDQQPAINDSL